VSALLGFSALYLAPAPGSGPAPVPRVPLEISLGEAIAPIASPAHAPPAPEPAPARPRLVAPRAPSRADARAASPPSAPAATVLAREPRPSAPIDMTDDTFVVGSAKGSAGGLIAPGGTSTVPGQGRGLSAGTASAGAASGDRAASTGAGRSASVGLASQSWSCPWPSEADPLPIDEETVVIRVVVRPDGTAESVTVVTDPGHGFGLAAASCALRTLFAPARAAGGEPVRATSAPIRVRFTRQ
jgi:protein TonB